MKSETNIDCKTYGPQGVLSSLICADAECLRCNFKVKEAKRNLKEYDIMNTRCLSLQDIADHFGPEGKMELTNPQTRRFFEFLKRWTIENRL